MDFTRFRFPVESSCFVVLHPADFARRLREEGISLLDLIESGDLDEELAKGRLLGLRLGGDGPRAILVGMHPAPPEVAALFADKPPFEFRLRARHGELFVGDPSHEERFSTKPFKVPAGRYRARLYPLRPTANANWALTLEPIAEFGADLSAWTDLPNEDDIVRRPPPRTKAETQARWVRHAKFGVGKVITEEGAGPSAKLLIAFPSGERRLLASFVEEAEDPSA
ncbi:hypothetical protein [Polyangium aurulentum]|uniref:hypothetical protein n=1 Tax=Polyangium aurulentum TaxID=2567896 RepID=UPI0010AE4E53|nr:hypothetical protein [Polyangium aurulentum]UQA57732.1 hypothetical protein E8A73_041700 [Polyangium aurulentum]